jgi:hypothetical protein
VGKPKRSNVHYIRSSTVCTWSSGGGANLAIGDLYVKANIEEQTPSIVNFKIYRRVARGTTQIVGSKIVNQIPANPSGPVEFSLEETVAGSASRITKTVVLAADILDGNSNDADTIAGAINAAGFTNIVALVDANNRIIIQHKIGGEIRINDTDGILNNAGFDPSLTNNLYAAPTGDANNDFVASNWAPLTYTASGTEPLNLTADGELWYSSVVDEVDILIHDGPNGWVGYKIIQ